MNRKKTRIIYTSDCLKNNMILITLKICFNPTDMSSDYLYKVHPFLLMNNCFILARTMETSLKSASYQKTIQSDNFARYQIDVVENLCFFNVSFRFLKLPEIDFSKIILERNRKTKTFRKDIS